MGITSQVNLSIKMKHTRFKDKTGNKALKCWFNARIINSSNALAEIEVRSRQLL
jgi:hypothetical protein